MLDSRDAEIFETGRRFFFQIYALKYGIVYLEMQLSNVQDVICFIMHLFNLNKAKVKPVFNDYIMSVFA